MLLLSQLWQHGSLRSKISLTCERRKYHLQLTAARIPSDSQVHHFEFSVSLQAVHKPFQ